MYEIVACFEGTQSHQITENSDHIRRIFDLAFASSAFETLAQYLNFSEDASNPDGAVIKVNTLKCLNYFVTGYGFFSQAGGL